MLKLILLTCFTILSTSVLATSKVDYVSENGFIVSNQITSEHSSAEIWRALVQDVDKWWPKDHSWWGSEGKFSIGAEAGGCFCEVAGDKSAEHMRISFVEPNKLLRMVGGLGPLQGMGIFGALDWQMQEQQNSTKVVLTYRVSGINPDGFKELADIVAQVQGIQLKALETYLTQSNSK